MLDFEKFVNCHGEHGAQALVEWLERSEGVRTGCISSLEERWNGLMAILPNQQAIAA